MIVGYECFEIIEELKQDIEDFGDIDMFALYSDSEVEGSWVLTAYDFAKYPLTAQLLQDRVAKIMKASKILEILEEQDRLYLE